MGTRLGGTSHHVEETKTLGNCAENFNKHTIVDYLVALSYGVGKQICILWSTGSPVHWFTSALVHWFTGELVHWCTG